MEPRKVYQMPDTPFTEITHNERVYRHYGKDVWYSKMKVIKSAIGDLHDDFTPINGIYIPREVLHIAAEEVRRQNAPTTERGRPQ